MNEIDIITRLFAPHATAPGAFGLRDDVARLSTDGGPLIVTSDALIETVHFLPDDPVATVARKLVRVNVSDIIAKGAVPREALLVLGWPRGRADNEIEAFAAAFVDELHHWGIALLGGDTVRSPSVLFLSLTLSGVCGESGPVLRKGARPGDTVWVTGEIGRGGRGLADAQAGRATRDAEFYRVPDIAPLAIADMLSDAASASMDVSDGLLADAQKLATASDVEITIALDKVPTGDETPSLNKALDAASAGDDYQTLFTAPGARTPTIRNWAARYRCPVTRIGTVGAGAGLRATWDGHERNLPKSLGFVHK